MSNNATARTDIARCMCNNLEALRICLGGVFHIMRAPLTTNNQRNNMANHNDQCHSST